MAKTAHAKDDGKLFDDNEINVRIAAEMLSCNRRCGEQVTVSRDQHPAWLVEQQNNTDGEMKINDN